MKAQQYPWKEDAVLVCRESGGERVAGQGSLYAMVHRLLIVKETSRHRYTITLPGRQAQPTHYSCDDFAGLILEHPRTKM